MDPPTLLAHIPAMLGFVPRESVVTVGLAADGTVIGGMRIDREALLGEGAPVVARGVAGHLERSGASAALLVAFTDDDVRVACPALDALHDAVAARVERADVWAVRRGRYFVPGCAREDCCGPAGHELPSPPEVVDEWSGSTTAGQRWWDERIPRGLDEWRVASARRWDRAIERGDVSRVVAARLAASIRDLLVRDYAVLRLAGAPRQACRDALGGRSTAVLGDALDDLLGGEHPPRDAAEAAIGARLADAVVVASEPGQRAPALTLAAVVAFRDEDAMGALVLCDAALSQDPEYRLALLMEAAASRGA